MRKIKNFKNYNESVFGTLAAGGAAIGAVALAAPAAAEGVGKLVGKLKKGARYLGSLIGRVGSDEDLAKEILDYLNNLPQDYVASTDFKKDRIYNPMPNNYVFFGNIFPRDASSEYRVDVLNTSELDEELHDKPYRVIISKLSQTDVDIKSPKGDKYVPFGDYKGGKGKNDPKVNYFKTPGANLLMTANPKADEEMIQLDCSLPISRRIYEKCEKIWNKTNPNTKGAARGGENKLKKFRGWTW
jgi:hypothetical protein